MDGETFDQREQRKDSGIVGIVEMSSPTFNDTSRDFKSRRASKKSLYERGRMLTDVTGKFRAKAATIDQEGQTTGIVVHVKNKKTNEHITEFQKSVFGEIDGRTSALSQVHSNHAQSKDDDKFIVSFRGSEMPEKASS